MMKLSVLLWGRFIGVFGSNRIARVASSVSWHLDCLRIRIFYWQFLQFLCIFLFCSCEWTKWTRSFNFFLCILTLIGFPSPSFAIGHVMWRCEIVHLLNSYFSLVTSFVLFSLYSTNLMPTFEGGCEKTSKVEGYLRLIKKEGVANHLGPLKAATVEILD